MFTLQGRSSDPHVSPQLELSRQLETFTSPGEGRGRRQIEVSSHHPRHVHGYRGDTFAWTVDAVCDVARIAPSDRVDRLDRLDRLGRVETFERVQRFLMQARESAKTIERGSILVATVICGSTIRVAVIGTTGIGVTDAIGGGRLFLSLLNSVEIRQKAIPVLALHPIPVVVVVVVIIQGQSRLDEERDRPENLK